MKKVLLFVSTLMFFAISSVAGNFVGIHKSQSGKIPKLPGKIVVITPRRGDSFSTYSQINISWRFAMGHVAQKCVSIKLYKGNAIIKNLTQRVCAQNFNWRIPNSLTEGKYRFKVATVDGKISTYSQIFSIGRVDLEVYKKGITINPQHPDMADQITLNIPVINVGSARADNSTAEINILSPDGKNYKNILANVGPIAPKRRYTVKEKVSLSKEQYGQYRVKILLNARNNVPESNKNNNRANYTFYANPLPDFAVCVDTGKRPRYGKNTTVRAYIFNKGYAPSKPCNLYIRIMKDNGKVKTYNIYIPAIDKGSIYSAAHVKYKWHPFLGIVEGERFIYVTIDNKNAIKETDESNNRATGIYYPTRYGGKHGAKNKVNCSWIEDYPSVDKSAVGIR